MLHAGLQTLNLVATVNCTLRGSLLADKSDILQIRSSGKLKVFVIKVVLM